MKKHLTSWQQTHTLNVQSLDSIKKDGLNKIICILCKLGLLEYCIQAGLLELMCEYNLDKNYFQKPI